MTLICCESATLLAITGKLPSDEKFSNVNQSKLDIGNQFK